MMSSHALTSAEKSSSRISHFGYQKVTEEDGKIFSFGSDSTGSPDNYVCRQRYLRSYVFTREEEGSKSVVGKFKRLFRQKKKGKSGNANSCSFSDTCLKFLGCIVKADVQT
ncbi:hypothetical protein OIU84_030010 [Salix udensis]|uniref:Uncharacterized protein n=1 Tax=Salix udensis TaxID=889485 RepID=A0AAD6P7Z2_9ROSI|nr:hypothetical protein OIU84_030010 [Salix udensis]